MKKSLLNKIIREEVKAALSEQVNPELDAMIKRFVAGLASKYSYQQSDAVMAMFEAMKRLGLINKDSNYMPADGLSEGAYQSATRNELAMYISLLSTALRNEKADGNTAMVDFLTKDIEEVKAALKAKGGGVAESAYAMLGGSNPLTGEAMKTKIVEPALGPNFETVEMLKNNSFTPRYKQLDAKFPRAVTDKWKVLYRSDSYQGYAKISPDGKVIKAAVLGPGSIVGVFYVKSGAGINESKPLKEYTKTNFQATVPGSGRAKIDPAFFAKLMPKSAKTSKEAEARIKLYNGSTMFVHSQYFEVTPNGNMPNKPIYQLHQQQYYNNDYNAPANLKGESVNVTFLTVIDITDGGKGVDVGVCYVDTKVFLAEYKVIFQLLKSQS
tara:strand:- start:3917 stop:5065 length:1149 start_codon:yes stop_codon:yes gene_type:complete